MADATIELDGLVRETLALAGGQRSRPLDFSALKPKNVVSVREEIRQRVESFRAHQLRFIRERNEYATSVLREIGPHKR